MSGPKDFDMDLAAPLLEGLAAFRAQQQSLWHARIAARRAAPRRNRPPLREASDLGSPSVRDVPATAPRDVSVTSPLADQAHAKAAKAAKIAEEFAELCEAIEARRDTLAEDMPLRAACGERFSSWAERCARAASLQPSEASLQEIRQAMEEGDLLVQHALDVAQQVERRRKVMQVIVESFNAIGFFTHLADEGTVENPAEKVVIVARKGVEEVKVSLPLGEQPVESRWNGQTDEKCVDSFVTYIQQMGKRGITCRPTRSDLDDRPRLRQAGRKDLPRSKSEGS